MAVEKRLQLYNTLTREKEVFSPINPGEVRMYTCGPTVYNYAHIGNLRAYVFADLVEKTLIYYGYKVKRVMNITDIGHLTSDADDGDDKMVKALKRENKPFTLEAMKEVAIFYKDKFVEDMQRLNIAVPGIMPFASEHIDEYVALIKKLQANGFAYIIGDGIYFEITKFPTYFDLSRNKENVADTESRIGVNSEKKSPLDFVLWKFADQNGIGYDTELGRGFPGWHIECSGMSIKYLGEQFDIHTGGIDHISVHHPNEIAQSEAATGKKPFVKYWMHNEHLDMAGEKMAKSGDNFLKLSLLEEKGINPIAYRFWLLMGSYRTKMNFNWEALEGAQIALKRLFRAFIDLGEDTTGTINTGYQARFKDFIGDDLETPKAVALIWDLLKDESISNADKKMTLLDFDKVLGLGLENVKEDTIPEAVIKLANERELARKNKDFKKSDELRAQINALGYEVKDSSDGYKITTLY